MSARDGHTPLKPVTIEGLHKHFRETYGLTEPQILTMLESSSRSVRQAMETVQPVLQGERDLKVMKQFFHGLKGLLLNMGEVEWAEYAKQMESLLEEGGLDKPEEAINCLGKGLAAVYGYIDDTTGSSTDR